MARGFVRSFLGYRFVVMETVTEARPIEARVKRGDWPGGPPLLNPVGLPD